MPVFVGAGTSSFMKGDGGVGFTRVTTTQRNAISGAVNGQVVLNTTTGVLEYYDGSAWTKVSAVLAKLNTVTGNIFAGLAQNLTLAGEGFLTSGLVVRFVQSADGIDTSVTVTPSSDTAATVAVPAAVYNNVTAGRVVTITVTNSDGSTSSGVNKTALALPSGGNISTSGGYRIHTFNSSGTFGLTFATDVEYLVVAGGAGGGVANGGGGGGGAGGYRTNVPGQTSGRNSSAESTLSLSVGNYTVTVGGGGAGNVHGGGSGSAGNAGSNSVFSSITSTGGGYGGGDASRPGGNGGSGGGAARDNQSEGTGTSGQGFDGGKAGANNAGGGGGGAGQAGSNGGGSNQGGNAGNGLQSNITGSAVYRGGGGGGGSESPSNSSDGSGDGGAGGGGRGGAAGSVGLAPQSGTANTGGGGGASGDYNSGGNHNGQNGGSGVVIVRYQL